MKELIVSLVLSFLIAETAQGVVIKYKDQILPDLKLNYSLKVLQSDLE